MQQNRLKVILAFVLVIIMVTQFQNCAQTPMEFQDAAITSRLSYFSFSYNGASSVYLDSKVILPQPEVSGSRSLKVVAIATPSDGTASILEYRIRFENSNGVLLCPVIQGSLLSGNNLIESECNFSGSSKLKKLIFRIRYQGIWYDQVQSFAGSGI